MAIKLNQSAYDHAHALIENGLEVQHINDDWDAVKPTDDEVVHYLNNHTLTEYGDWFLGIDTDADQHDKSKYLYPVGDLKIVYRSALALAEEEATDHDHDTIASAAEKLLELIDQLAE